MAKKKKKMAKKKKKKKKAKKIKRKRRSKKFDVKVHSITQDGILAGFFGDMPGKVCLIGEKRDGDQVVRRVIAFDKCRRTLADLGLTLMDLGGIRSLRIMRNGELRTEFGPVPEDWTER